MSKSDIEKIIKDFKIDIGLITDIRNEREKRRIKEEFGEEDYQPILRNVELKDDEFFNIEIIIKEVDNE